MQLYIKRMITEKNDLQAKIKKANCLLANVPFGMNKKQVLLLAEQVKAMEIYLACLNERLKYEKCGGQNANN